MAVDNFIGGEGRYCLSAGLIIWFQETGIHNTRRLLSVEKQVAIALRRLASGESQVSVGASFNVGQSTVCQFTTRDVEIFKGGAVKESQYFKREVLEKGLPGKGKITCDTELFGAKRFLIYVEPVFSEDGEKIGVNYMGMEITDQIKRRENMAKLWEEIAV
ncbi:unnamed protein product [Lactuca saligna]|uniref:Uncharacterized protein n=1 Tax=Lactuca saligna TaxID=75948 RepID=A0AA35YHK8_LACSI|nr:unnamed protein product [Lactuca saligna]